MKSILILFISILPVLIILSIVIYLSIKSKKILTPQQQNKDRSLDYGYGYYSETIKGECIPENGNYGPGYRINTQKCIRHPTTNNLCISESGYQTNQQVQNKEKCYLNPVKTVLISEWI